MLRSIESIRILSFQSSLVFVLISELPASSNCFLREVFFCSSSALALDAWSHNHLSANVFHNWRLSHPALTQHGRCNFCRSFKTTVSASITSPSGSISPRLHKASSDHDRNFSPSEIGVHPDATGFDISRCGSREKAAKNLAEWISRWSEDTRDRTKTRPCTLTTIYSGRDVGVEKLWCLWVLVRFDFTATLLESSDLVSH